ncbi:unnamed protein product, partial [Phaeothamnion confervicola]
MSETPRSSSSGQRAAAPPPLQIGDEVPDFTCESHLGVVTLHDLIDGCWGVILAFPRGNDAVACTEIGMLAKLWDEFESRNCKLLAVGVDTRFGHRTFVKDTQELQNCEVKFPVVADAGADIFSAFGLVRRD